MFPESKVIEIFEKQRERLLRGMKSDKNPVAVILGGQSAAGKGALVNSIENDFPDKKFLVVNGDLYRVYHPEHLFIAKNDIENYSAQTQIFSNVFTEKLIEIAAQNKFNSIVEGTMRNPVVPEKTANLFRKYGFHVHVYVIAAHPIITELGVYRRYEEQIQNTGIGRLADIKVHDEACEGLLKSVDHLYINKRVDGIHIFSYLAKKEVQSIQITSNSYWNMNNLPSFYICKERNDQITDPNFVTTHINLGKKTLKTIDSDLKDKVSSSIKKLSSYLN
jgi:hypothetical protein